MTEDGRVGRHGRTGIVVGVDGSPGSAAALAWADDHVERYGLILPITTWRFPLWVQAGPAALTRPPSFDELESMAMATAATVVADVAEDRRRQLLVTEAAAGPTLVAHGADASMIVVGTRGRGAVTDTLLGSVSSYVVHHATVPAVVVPVGASPRTERTDIVVGVDGSDNGVRALQWALAASEEGDTVMAVHAWTSAVSVFHDQPADPGGHFEVEATRILNDAVARATAEVGSFRGELRPLLIEGDPRQVLADKARDSAMLVVGARGRGGVAHLLLGSVASSLVHRPVVPTVVVPSGSADDD